MFIFWLSTSPRLGEWEWETIFCPKGIVSRSQPLWLRDKLNLQFFSDFRCFILFLGHIPSCLIVKSLGIFLQLCQTLWKVFGHEKCLWWLPWDSSADTVSWNRGRGNSMESIKMKPRRESFSINLPLVVSYQGIHSDPTFTLAMVVISVGSF